MPKKVWLMSFAATLIASCQPALVNLPRPQNCPPAAVPQKDKCSDLEIPPHIPKKFYIKRDGDKAEADAAGTAFLKLYTDLAEQIEKCTK
jgi:hypothetical protein